MRNYRRLLPHWRMRGAVYFVTWRLDHGQELLTESERDQLVSILRAFDGQRYTLWAYVIMDDHVHALVEPCGAFRLEQIIHSWKSFSTWQMQRGGQRRGRIWQREYYDRIIREGNDFIEKLNYIIDNPLRRWPAAETYRWVWCSDDAVE